MKTLGIASNIETAEFSGLQSIVCNVFMEYNIHKDNFSSTLLYMPNIRWFRLLRHEQCVGLLYRPLFLSVTEANTFCSLT